MVGRETDIVKTKSGNFLIVHFFTGIFEFYPSIKQFCIIQRDYEGIEVEYIPESYFRLEDLEDIRGKILAHLDEPFNIKFIKVDNIPPTASGKPQIVISKL